MVLRTHMGAAKVRRSATAAAAARAEPAAAGSRQRRWTEAWAAARRCFVRLTGGTLQRAAVLAFSVRVLSAAILYVSQIVLARWMGSFEYGLYVFVWTWVLVLGGLASGGLGTAAMRLVPEYRERSEFARLRGLLCYGRLAAMAAATVIALIALAALHVFGERIPAPYVLPAYLALACLPMIALGEMHDGIGRGGGWLSEALLPPYVLRPLLVLLAMAAAHAAGFRISAETAMAAAVIATWITALVQLLLMQRRIARELPPGGREFAPAEWTRTSLPLLAVTGAELLIQNTDLLVIGKHLSPEEAAIYFAAAKTMALVVFVHYAVGSAAAKRFATLHARGDGGALAAFARDSVRWTFWPSFAATLVLLALGKPLLGLFGPQFVDGYPVMLVLAAGFLGRAAMGPSEFLLNMAGEQRLCAFIVAAAAALNLLLQLLLVPSFGAIGAAVATSAVLIGIALTNATVARRRLGLEIAIWKRPGGATAQHG